MLFLAREQMIQFRVFKWQQIRKVNRLRRKLVLKSLTKKLKGILQKKKEKKKRYLKKVFSFDITCIE